MTNTRARYIESHYVFKKPKRFSKQWIKEYIVEKIVGIRLPQLEHTGIVFLTPERFVRSFNFELKKNHPKFHEICCGREIESIVINVRDISKHSEYNHNRRIPAGKEITVDDVPKFNLEDDFSPGLTTEEFLQFSKRGCSL